MALHVQKQNKQRKIKKQWGKLSVSSDAQKTEEK